MINNNKTTDEVEPFLTKNQGKFEYGVEAFRGGKWHLEVRGVTLKEAKRHVTFEVNNRPWEPFRVVAVSQIVCNYSIMPIGNA